MNEEEQLEDWHGEPETPDVYAEQAEADWSDEPSSDAGLSAKAWKLIRQP